MQISIPYGNSAKAVFAIPDQNYYGMLEPLQVTPADDPVLEIEKAIDNPIGCPSLKDIVKYDRRVNIICDDISRPTPISLILPTLIKKLKEIGVSDSNVKIVMALGSHRYMTENEMRQRVGDDIYQNYKVVNSEFRKKENLIYLGTSRDGVEIHVSKEAMDCDIRIGIGNIVPHPVMGWSGGGKILFPGVTGEKTVAQFHMQGGMSNENLYGREECLIRLNMEEWVDIVGLHFVINTVLTPKMAIYKVVAGHYIKAHREGVKHAKVALGCKMRTNVDIVVVSSYPADIDFWQSGKGMFSAEHALKDHNGTIVLVTPNYEGIGPHDEYPKYFGMDNAEKILLRAYRGELVEGDPLAISVGTSMSKLRRRVNLVMVTDGVTEEEADICKIKHYPLCRLQQAVDDAMAKYENPLVAAASHGGELFIYNGV
ncbi:MAG TPA: nickel-dependent lactate racemase [Clostridiales bacterium]|nr:nickel-dependent lactate racemase [Clostridiales bacterium]